MTVVDATKPAPAPARQSGATRLVQRVFLVRELGILLALLLLVGVTAATNPRFLSAQSVKDLLLGSTILAVLAVGQTVVVVSRNVDLSVGSVLGLTAFATGSLFVASPGLPIPVVLLAGVLLGAVCGAVNGSLIVAARVPALVVTLGTLYVFRGVDYAWATATDTQQVNAYQMAPEFLSFGSGAALGVPNLTLIALAVLAVAAYGLHHYRAGRELYAIGSNPEAARLAGIPTGRRVFGAFVISGALVGLGGVLHAAYFGTINASVGNGEELSVVAAVVVGGVAIFGGSGTVVGAALGALLLTTVTSALPILGVPAFWQRAVDGAALLVAISLDRAVMVRLAARLRAERAVRRE